MTKMSEFDYFRSEDSKDSDCFMSDDDEDSACSSPSRSEDSWIGMFDLIFSLATRKIFSEAQVNFL